MKRELIRTNAFVPAAKRYSKKNSRDASEIEFALTRLAAEAIDPRLKTHILKGDLEGLWACTAGYDVRIDFEFVEQQGQEKLLLLSVGTHDEVY